MREILLFVFILIWSAITCMAQNKFLLLDKVGSRKGYRIYVGQRLSFTYKGDNTLQHGRIMDLKDSLITLTSGDLHIGDIGSVDIRRLTRKGMNTRLFGSFIQQAGLGYLLIDQFNQAVVQGDGLGVESSVLIVSGSLFTAGTLLYALKRKYFRINGRNRIRIIE